MIKIPKVLENVRRRKIRYVLYRTLWEYEEGADPVTPSQVDMTPGQIKAIIRHFVTSQYPISGFAKNWDIGIDDLDTMVNRGEKYWLFGISRFIHVKRPIKEVYVPVEAVVDEETGEVLKPATMRPELRPFADLRDVGIKFMVEKGFAKELSENHWDYDYQKILEGCPDRTAWV